MKNDLPGRLRDAAERLGNEPVAVSHLADAHGSAALGTLMVLLATPCVLPVPGVGNIMGAALVLMSLSMWRGDEQLQLPERVAQMQLSPEWARRVLHLLARFYALAGRWTRHRLAHLATPRRRSWMSLKVGVMGVLIFLPIPFGNVLPALSLVLLGLGLAFRDGVAVMLSAGVGALAVAYTTALGVLAWVWGVEPLMAWLGW